MQIRHLRHVYVVRIETCNWELMKSTVPIETGYTCKMGIAHVVFQGFVIVQLQDVQLRSSRDTGLDLRRGAARGESHEPP